MTSIKQSLPFSSLNDHINEYASTRVSIVCMRARGTHALALVPCS